MRNELRKRLKGLMALVLCVGMMFGNSLMVFAGNGILSVQGSSTTVVKGGILNSGTTIEASLTSGGIEAIYYKNSTDSVGESEKDLEYEKQDSHSLQIGNKYGITKWRVKDIEYLEGTGADMNRKYAKIHLVPADSSSNIESNGGGGRS